VSGGDRLSIVIPGRAEGANPESTTHHMLICHPLLGGRPIAMDSGFAGFAGAPE
jgi:hypothetical protein